MTELSSLILYISCLIIYSHSQKSFQWVKQQRLNEGLPDSIQIFSLNMKNSPFQTPLTGSFARFDFNDKNLEFEIVHTEHQHAKTPMEWAQTDEKKVYAVINGGFFFRQKLKSASFIEQNGKVYYPNNPKGMNIRLEQDVNPSLGAIGQHNNGKFEIGWIYSFGTDLKTYIYKRPNPIPGPKPQQRKGKHWNIKNGIGAGPVLIKDRIILGGKYQGFDAQTFVQRRHPRSGICYDKHGKLVLISIDGRGQHSSGVTLQEFSMILYDLGCVDALNLDGGGSSLLYANDHILTHFSDKSPRKVISAIVIRDKFKKKSKNLQEQESQQ